MNSWLIDTHCHLDLFKDITSKFEMEDALSIKTITVTNAPSFFEHNCNLFKNANNIRVALGLHPELVSDFGHEIGLFKELLHRTRYVGEIGLDGSKQYAETYSRQVEIFNTIVDCIAEQGNKIVTIHSRNAAKQTIEILSRIPKEKKCKIILHWYSSEIKHIKTAIDAGFYFSINNKMVATKKGNELITAIPLNRILTETDAPFTYMQGSDRTQILLDTIDGLSKIFQTTASHIKHCVFENFKELLG